MVSTKSTSKPGGRPAPESAGLSIEEIERLINDVQNGDLHCDDDAIASFLLLVSNLAHEQDWTAREEYVRAAERVLLIYTRAVSDAGDKLLLSRLDEMRGVKRVSVELKPETQKRTR